MRFGAVTRKDGDWLAGFAHQKRVLEGRCADVARDPGETTKSSNYNYIVGENHYEVEQRLAPEGVVPTRRQPDRVDRMIVSDFVVGTVEQILPRPDMTIAGCASWRVR